MGLYIYGIVISIFMIAAGVSGPFFDEGAGINIPLVAVGAVFLAIDIVLYVRAKKGQ